MTLSWWQKLMLSLVINQKSSLLDPSVHRIEMGPLGAHVAKQVLSSLYLVTEWSISHHVTYRHGAEEGVWKGPM